jgi:hypothetical protein
MLIYDDIYSWEGWGGSCAWPVGNAGCVSLISKRAVKKGLTHLKPMIVIVSDVGGSPMSVRSCSGHIATSIAREFNIKPQQMLFIEYYPQTVYGQHREHTISEKYDLVEFNWHQDKAIEPKWRTLKPPLLDMVQELVEAK